MVHRIALSGKRGEGLFAVVDDDDFEWLSRFQWHFAARPNRLNPHQGYAARSAKIGGRYTLRLMHREILMPLEGQEVDHRDGNGLNNAKSNLRLASRHENARNRGKRGGRLGVEPLSSYKGVVYHKRAGRQKRWFAHIVTNRQRISLGYFATEEEAAEAYDKAALLLHGEFASLNFKAD